jgi:hypothetical protein
MGNCVTQTILIRFRKVRINRKQAWLEENFAQGKEKCETILEQPEAMMDDIVELPHAQKEEVVVTPTKVEIPILPLKTYSSQSLRLTVNVTEEDYKLNVPQTQQEILQEQEVIPVSNYDIIRQQSSPRSWFVSSSSRCPNSPRYMYGYQPLFLNSPSSTNPNSSSNSETPRNPPSNKKYSVPLLDPKTGELISCIRNFPWPDRENLLKLRTRLHIPQQNASSNSASPTSAVIIHENEFLIQEAEKTIKHVTFCEEENQRITRFPLTTE